MRSPWHFVTTVPLDKLETSLWRRPFIKDGADDFTVESQPESVLLRKFGNLSFSILIVYRPDALQVRFVNSTVFPYAAHLAFNLLRERLHDFYYLVVASRFNAPRQLGFALQKLALVRTWRSGSTNLAKANRGSPRKKKLAWNRFQASSVDFISYVT